MSEVEVRKMTIARGLTRIKTIQAQLDRIVSEIESYAAWSDKEKHPYGETKVANDAEGLKTNHKGARQQMASLWQQYQDLTLELVRIQTAINRANDTTNITIGTRTLTIAEAKVIQDRIIGNPRKGVMGVAPRLVNAFGGAVRNAERAVKAHNQQYANVKDEAAKAPLLADILYLIDPMKVTEQADYIALFSAEFNATLNEINAITEITL